MAKKDKQTSDVKDVKSENKPALKPKQTSDVKKVTIEIIKPVGGMAVGLQKAVPERLAKQMVKLKNAKIIQNNDI